MSSPAKMKTLLVVAGSVTAVLAVVDVVLCVVCMLYHTCAIQIDDKDPSDYSFWHYFYTNYLAGEDCEYDNANPAINKPSREWATCNNGNPSVPTITEGGDMTNPESTFIWVTVYLVLAIAWGVCGSLLFVPASRGLKKGYKSLVYVWFAATAVILTYGMAAACIYLSDMEYPISYDECRGSDPYDIHTKMIEAVLVLPMFFARGFLVWFALVGLAVAVLALAARYNEPQTLFGDRSQVGKSLSAYDETVIPTIAEEVDNRDDDSSDGGDVSPAPQMVQASMATAMAAAAEINTAEERKLSAANWQYAQGHINSSFDDDEGMFDQPAAAAAYDGDRYLRQDSLPAPRPLAPSQLHIANQPPIIVPHPGSPPPTSANVDRSDSDRRLGRPGSPDPAPGGFKLPRAREVATSLVAAIRLRSTSSDREDDRGRSGKPVIRTPSGRETSATEYLARDYRYESPERDDGGRHRRDRSQGDDVDRYFVRLKD